MILLEFFTNKKTCKHSKVKPDVDLAYCPDCGELVENQWYLTRCACCSVKLKSMIKNNEIVPVQKFCHNCGSKSHITEKLNHINFIDIRFAMHMKAVITNEIISFTQSWVDSNERINLKLIASSK